MATYNLKPLVNNGPLYNSFLDYLDEKIQKRYRKLATAKGDEVPTLQGQLKELSALKKLREEINGSK